MSSAKYDLGAKCKSYTIGCTTLTAGGTGDNTAVSGPCIDVSGYESAKVIIGYNTTLTAAKTLSFAVEYQQVDTDATAFETAVAIQAATVAKTGAATGAIGQVEFDIPLNDKKRFFTINFTPDLSHTSSDTANVYGVIELYGANNQPVTRSA